MSKPWYAIKRTPPVAAALAAAGSDATTHAEVLIYGDIGESWWAETVTAVQFVKDLAALEVDAITVRINSIGGSVPDGLAIFNALRRHAATVTTVNDGMALSIASLILMAGDTVQMADNAMLMIHAPWTYASGNAEQLREQADVLDKWSEAMASSYAAKTGKPRDEILALLQDSTDHYFTAAEALAGGWIDEITDAAPAAAQAALRVVAESRFRGIGKNPAAAAAQPSNVEITMTNPVTPTAAPQTQPPAKTEEQIRAEALAADKARRDAIRAAAAPFAARTGVPALVERLCEDTAVDAAAANQQILALLAKDVTPVAGGHIQTLDDETDKRRNAQVAAMLVRAGVATDEQRKLVAAGNPYRSDTLLDMARAALDRAGFQYRGMTKLELVAAAFTQSTSDFPVLLENAMHKALQAGYAIAPDTWTRFCKKGSVTDFRDHPRYRVGSFGNLDAKNELGEFKNKTIPDGEKGVARLGTKGNIINLSREAIVNDDLGIFVGLASMLGRAAKRTIEADVYALLALNSGLGPTLDDGYTLFHAQHNNVGTGAALSVASVDADRVLMAQQKDVGGNDYLDLRPSVLLVPTSLGGAARVLNAAEYDVDEKTNKAQNTPNKVRGLYADIVDTPRIAGTRRYSFAAPVDAPVIEVVFLDGNEEPYLEVQDGFDVDGSRWKVRSDYGVGANDYRGATTNAGA